MSPRDIEGDPNWWNSQARTLAEARWAVWSVAEESWERSTQDCVDQIVKWLPPSPHRLLDIGCGIGRLTIPLARRFPAALVVGCDVAERMLRHARRAGLGAGLSTQWVRTDGRTVPPGPFDGAVTVVVMQHNARRACARLVRSVAEQLAPGGRFVYQTVGDSVFEDEGHVPDAVLESWATDAGLTVVAIEHGVIYNDWTWVVAEHN